MTLARGCPGARLFREVRPEYMQCPHCGAEVEVWSDELVARCQQCGWPVGRERGASCIDWCAYAAECVGAQKLRHLKGDASAKGRNNELQRRLEHL